MASAMCLCGTSCSNDTIPKPTGKMAPWTELFDFTWSSLHIIPSLPFHSVITLSAKKKSSPHPKTSRKRSCPCSARVKLQFWLWFCIPSHLRAGYTRGQPRHAVSQLILLMGYLKQTLIALKSRQLSTAASG